MSQYMALKLWSPVGRSSALFTQPFAPTYSPQKFARLNTRWPCQVFAVYMSVPAVIPGDLLLLPAGGSHWKKHSACLPSSKPVLREWEDDCAKEKDEIHSYTGKDVKFNLIVCDSLALYIILCLIWRFWGVLSSVYSGTIKFVKFHVFLHILTHTKWVQILI